MLSLTLVGVFVAVVVEMEVNDFEFEVNDLELEVDVVGIVWSCVNKELCFLWHLSQMSLEGKMSNVGGHPFGMVMPASSLIEVFFLDGGCLGRVTGPRKEVVVVEMVVEMVGKGFNQIVGVDGGGYIGAVDS